MVRNKKTTLNISSHPSYSSIVPANLLYANTILHDSAPSDLKIEDKANQINTKSLRNKSEPKTQVKPPNLINMNNLYPMLSNNDFPSNSFVGSIVGSRRTGKSSVCESLLCNELKNRFNTYFLFSPTLSGFDTIPNNHKFRNLDLLPNIIKKQQDAVKNNIQVSKLKKKTGLTKNQIGHIEKDYIESKICIILDDLMGEGSLKNNKLLNKISTNGRHICSPDKTGMTDMSFLILSQSVSGLDATIRRNSDILLASRLTSKKDRETLVNENMILDSSRGGISMAYNNYDEVTLNRDYSFIALLNHKSNKSKYANYVRQYQANMNSFQDVKLCGDKDDWDVEKPFFDFC